MAVAVIVAAVAALGVIYRADRLDWVGRTGMKISVVAICVAALALLAFVLLHRTRIGPPAAIVATGAIAFACHLAINSSSSVFTDAVSSPENRSLYHAALDHVDFVESATPDDDALPWYWYSDHPRFRSIQSMYSSGTPTSISDFRRSRSVLRERLASYRPETIVMLCDTRDCEGAAKRLRRAGYPFAEFRARQTERGDVRFWTVVSPESSRVVERNAARRDGPQKRHHVAASIAFRTASTTRATSPSLIPTQRGSRSSRSARVICDLE